jgi:uncharacterized caspase-like protein
MPKENVAIILAVSDCGPTNSLPGCKNDGALMRAILEKAGKFAPDNTLYIDTDTSSGTVKSALAGFVSKHAGQEVGEVFFYYTGHGLFDGTNFYYCPCSQNLIEIHDTCSANHCRIFWFVHIHSNAWA